MKPQILVSILAIALCATFLTSCASPGFRDAWAQAASEPKPEDIIGAWEGSWKSESTGHTGGLRCLVSLDETSPGDYRFHYWASWKRFISGEFVVNYPVTRRSGRAYFGGRHDLGKALGGTFTHEGVATSSTFDATYSAAQDKGTFDMTRP